MKRFNDDSAAAAADGGTVVTPMAALAAMASQSIFVDLPRLLGAKLYPAVMKGKINSKVEPLVQNELVRKISYSTSLKRIGQIQSLVRQIMLPCWRSTYQEGFGA